MPSKNFRTLGVFFTLFFLLTATVFGATVKRVLDGDTFILANGQRVRMIGINAPEIDHPKYHKKGNPFGEESKKYLQKRIQGQDVKLKKGSEEFDRFGRRLAYVYLPDGTFVNREMVLLGYAETFRKFSFTYKEEFLKLEEDARTKKIGMWAGQPQGWLQSLKKRFSRS